MNDTLRALFDEVAASIGSGADLVVAAPSSDGKGTVRVRPSPRLVLAPDAEHRLLIVDGMEVNASGDPIEAHASAGNVGLYGFTLKQGRWLLTSQVHSFDWSGSEGKVGDLQPLDLGGGRLGLAVSGGFCGQGYCVDQLEVFALSAHGAKQVLSERVYEDTGGATGPCDEMVKDTMEAHARDPSAELTFTQLHCVATRGDLSLQPRSPGEWPDIKIAFKGETVDIDSKTLEAMRTSHDVDLVLRYDGERYKPISGHNPIAARQ